MRQPVPQRSATFVVAVLLAILDASLAAQLPRRIDCGDLDGASSGEPGWELLGESLAPPGVSLSPAPLDTVHVGYHFPDLHGTGTELGVVWPVDVLAADVDELGATHRLTALQLADHTLLSITGLVPNARQRVKLELGALFPWIDLGPSGTFDAHESLSRAVRVEVVEDAAWRDAVRDVRCGTGWLGSTLATDVGSIVDAWIVARADATGRIRLRFSTEGTDPVYLSGFEVHAYEALPLRYHRTAAGPLQALDPALQSFAAAMAARDYDGAELVAAGLADPFRRGVARLFLAGWLDGSRDGRPHLLASARADLAAGAGTHAAVPWLLDQLDDFERARAHLAARGYESARACPSAGGTGFLNEGCGPRSSLHAVDAGCNPNAQIALRCLWGLVAPMHGATLLHDLAASNADDPSVSLLEPSPLAFRSLALFAETLVDMNPQLAVDASDPESLELRERATAIVSAFFDLGFFTADVPDEVELLLFDRILELGAQPHAWTLDQLGTLFTPAQLASAWWADDVAAPPSSPGAPLWVELERHHARLHDTLAREWLLERVQGHELGGGWGDDVELLAQLALPLVASHDQTDRRLLDAVHELVRYGLDEQGDVVGGYFAGGPTDVEHSAEYTTNTWLAERGLYGLTPRMAQDGLDVVRHLLRDDDPSKAFCGTNAKGRLHFRSYVFTADGPSDASKYALDVLLDGRATTPGVGLGDHAVLPSTHRSHVDLRRLADAFRADAEDGSGGKPEGWFAPAQWPSGAFGENGVWYSESGTVGDAALFAKTLHAYGLELLRLAWRDTGDWTYLVPAARLFRTVQAWDAAGRPSGAPGSASWLAQQVEGGTRFGPLVIASRGALAAEPALATHVDPLTGAPYVDQGLLDAMRTWVEVEFTGQTNVLRYALTGVVPCETGTKATNSVWAPWQNVIAYERVAWPMLAKHVLHTDRVFLRYLGGGPETLCAAGTGEVLAEGVTFRPLVRWSSRLDQGTDLSFLCNDRAYDGSSFGAFVWNAQSSDVPLELVLDVGMPPGRYRVSWAPDPTACDMFPASTSPQSVTLQKRGATARAFPSVAPGMNLVRVERIGDPVGPPAGWELSLDPPRVEVRKHPGGADLALVTHVANVGASASPSALLELRLAFLFPDGRVVPLPGLPDELLLGDLAVHGLHGADDWAFDSQDVELLLPVDALLAAVLTSGLGLQVRAQLLVGAGQGDTSNDDQTRGWYLPQIEMVPGS